MAIQFLNSIDLNRNQLIRAVVHSDSSDPSVGNEVAGQLFFNTDTGALKYYNSGWQTISTQTYTLPTATNSALGGVKIGYSENGKNYPVELSSGKMFVNVPWTDSNELSAEEVQDIAGPLVATGGTKTLISVTYDDTNNNMDFVVDNDLANYDNSNSGFITATLTDAQVRSKISGTGLISYNSTSGVISTTANNYSLPAASSTTRGGVELGSDTELTATYATGTTGTAEKTYPVQVNSAGQMAVSVPWSQRAATNEDDIKTILAALDSDDTLYIGDTGNDATITIRGNLTVSGTTTTVNTTNLEITDKLIVVGKDASSLGDTDGAGLQFGANGSAPTITWNDSDSRLTSNKIFAATSFVGNIAGNASTATKLATARNIGGVSFDGSAAIDLPGVNSAGNQNTTGNAATATTAAALTTARNIGGVSFNGSANIDLPGVNTAGNQNTTGNAATATILATSRSIAGQSFNGSADITIASTDLSNTSAITLNTATQTLTNKSIGATQLTGTIAAGRLPALISSFVLNITTSGVAGNSGEASGSTEYTVTHGFTGRGITARVYETASPYQEVFTEVTYPEDEKVKFTFGTAPTAGAYTAVIHSS